MNRFFLRGLLGIMLFTVVGQALLLRDVELRSVARADLHESRIIPFLHQIRVESPLVYDSALLNLIRIQNDENERRFRAEERIVAGALLARLTGAE